MATPNSLAAISRRISRTLLSNPHYHQQTTNSFFSTGPAFNPDELDSLNSVSESPESPSDKSDPAAHRPVFQTVLEGGLDVGIYKAILVGRVGQSPIQKRMKNGKMMTLTTLGTGGIRNERIPFPNEEPTVYADRCNVQWHRVAIYPERLGDVVMNNAAPGTILYLEGNLESKIYTDQVTGIIKRLREIAIRRNGRVVFLGNDGEFTPPSSFELKGVGYF